MDRRELSNEFEIRGPLVFVTLLFASANFLVVLLMHGGRFGRNDEIFSIIMSTWVGAVPAQLGLLAVWVVLGSQLFWQRLLTSSAAGITLVLSWCLGMVITVNGDLRSVGEFLSVVLLCIPLFFLAIQSPLWLVRYWFNWRIVKLSDKQDRRQPPSFRIRDFMIGTAVVAIVVTLARLGRPNFAPEAGYWTGLFVGLAIAFSVSLSLLPLAVLAVLRWEQIVGGVTGLFGVTLIWLMVLLMVSNMRGAGGDVSMEVLVWSLCAVTSLVACLAGPLYLVRRAGYRLVWYRSHGQADTERMPP